MPNEPKPAREKRTPPMTRKNAQDDHEGSPHHPEEFLKAMPDMKEQQVKSGQKGKPEP